MFNKTLILIFVIVSVTLSSPCLYCIGQSQLDLSNQIISITSNGTDYLEYLGTSMGEGAKFQIVFFLLPYSNSSVQFSYEMSTGISVEEDSGSNYATLPINYTNIVAGTLDPGTSIKINHTILECPGDVTLGIEFNFIADHNATAELSLNIITIEYGNTNCGSQFGIFPFGSIRTIIGTCSFSNNINFHKL